MGGGVAMRAAAKAAGIGVLNGGFRGSENPVVSAARQASRSIAASVVSSSSLSSDNSKLMINNNDLKSSSSIEKPIDDWEFAEDELFMEAGEPMPRLVFGGAPTIQEAKQATSDLNFALEKTYLSSNATNGQNGDVETEPCLVSETLVTPIASNQALQAFRLLNENPKAQSVVASIACDPNVWNAVLQNTELQEFLHTHNTDVVFPEDTESKVNDWSPKPSESNFEPGKGIMDYVEDIKQKISVTVVEMVNSLSDTFQNIFGGSPKDVFNVNPDGAAEISVEKTAIGASLMGLAIMVIGLVLLKRPAAA
ncbi:uncharacterized protein [Rutidosis leptorrhynchoides]|uniref:uncharacterized protein n=1 Tax=Rutidosis leptorrhynchoides TaxID=125765 RepID=UPI003A99F018